MLRTNKRNQDRRLPTASDIQKLNNYLLQSAKTRGANAKKREKVNEEEG